MRRVAEKINEATERLKPPVRSPATAPRHDRSRAASLVGSKLLRSSIKIKSVIGLVESGERSDVVETLGALVESTKASVTRLKGEMDEWTRSTRAGIDGQMAVLDGWTRLADSRRGSSASGLSHLQLLDEFAVEVRLIVRVNRCRNRLLILYLQVLEPVSAKVWHEVSYEIANSLAVKTDHLASLFLNPLRVSLIVTLAFRRRV